MAAPKIRVYELSKILGIGNKDLMTLLEKEFGIELKSHSSTIEKDVADKVTEIVKKQKVSAPGQPQPQPAMEVSQPDKPAPPKAAVPPVNKDTVSKQPEPIAAKPEPSKPAQPNPSRPESQSNPSSNAPVTQQRPANPATTHTAGQRPPQPHQQQNRPAHPQQSNQGQSRPQGQPGQGYQGQSRPQGQPGQGYQGQSRPQGQPGQGYQGQPRPQGQPGQPHQAVASTQSTPGGRPHQPMGGAHHKGGHRPGGMPQGKQPMGGGRPGGKDFKHGKGPVTPLAVETAPVETVPKVVRIHDPLTVSELAQRLKLRETEIIKHLFMKGAMVTVNQTLDVAYARSVAEEFGFEIEEAPHPALNKGEYNPALAEKKQPLDETKYKHLQPRPPVVSIMGHVDHGKTSLLDAIRETRHKIVDTEAGGITQSIGAYTVEKNGQKIVFLDTPGHEAFTSMRMRGAKATDVAILVVAADDGVMPQTIEAINHAKAANIPIIVAVNKIDKAGADPEKVLVQLSDHGLVSEKWGGDTVTVEVSALQLIGLDDLLEMILLVSELLELKADPTVQGEGVIIEAQLDKRKGPTATALVQNGTLKVGDNVLIGAVGGRVRALFNDSGERVIKAGPATPVEILGLSDVPRAGDPFQVIRDEKKFKQLFNEAKLQERDQRLGSRSLSTGFATSGPRADGSGEAAAEQKEFNVIIKADTQGSAEAVNGALSRLSTDEIKVKVLHTGTGDISEADVMLATASQALIIGFNVREDGNAQRTAEQAGVQIKKYDVIYHINEEMEKLMLGKLSPETQEVESGQAEVRQLFTVGKNVVIAGCMVTKGKVVRNGKAKVTRNGKEIFAGTVDNLKRFKDDAKEVAAGYECGISFNKFNDLEIGDIITVFTVEETERTSL